jgi:hypothetical protein
MKNVKKPNLYGNVCGSQLIRPEFNFPKTQKNCIRKLRVLVEVLLFLNFGVFS